MRGSFAALRMTRVLWWAPAAWDFVVVRPTQAELGWGTPAWGWVSVSVSVWVLCFPTHGFAMNGAPRHRAWMVHPGLDGVRSLEDSIAGSGELSSCQLWCWAGAQVRRRRSGGAGDLDL